LASTIGTERLWRFFWAIVWHEWPPLFGWM